MFLCCMGTEYGLSIGSPPISPIEEVVFEGILCSTPFFLKFKVIGSYQKPIVLGCGSLVNPTLKVAGCGGLVKPTLKIEGS